MLEQLAAAVLRLPGRLHRDQRGTISIISVFVVMVLTMLLGMVMNVGRQIDGKIRLQNSADAAAYSGSVVLARGMNTLAFTNHLLADVFALTAFMREARDRQAESFVPDVLAAWSEVAPKFSMSEFPKFMELGPAILQKVPLEQNLVTTYGEWAAATSERVLPLLEEILEEELIPQYQRAVVEAFPDVAQMAALEVARINGRPNRGRGEMRAALWRASGQPVGGIDEWADPTFPVVDPAVTTLPNRQRYVRTARAQRRRLAHRYLGQWNRQSMNVFDREGKMGQFAGLWRSFTCGQLEKLLEEDYPYVNLPHVIRTEAREVGDPNRHLQENFTFIATVYWDKLPEMMPGLFRNPLDGDSVAFAETRMFIPRRRLVWKYHHPQRRQDEILAGVPGEPIGLPVGEEPEPIDDGTGHWHVGRQSVPTHWDLLNQRWTCQLVPATQATMAQILQTRPALGGDDVALPSLGSLTSEDIRRISPH